MGIASISNVIMELDDIDGPVLRPDRNPALITALRGKSMECRYMAAAALRKIGGSEGLAAIDRFHDLDWKVWGTTWRS